jgi:hypothetical protein
MAKFSGMYEAEGGRPSIAPEKLIRAMLLQVLFLRAQLVEQATTCCSAGSWACSTTRSGTTRCSARTAPPARRKLFNATVEMADGAGCSRARAWTHVDPGLGENCGARTAATRGARSNATHQTSDPESRLYRKSNAAPALPSYLGHVLTDNRHGLVVNVRASQSDGTAEREVAAQMLADAARPGQRVTVGADKAYDTQGFVKACREMNVTPHVAQNTARAGGSAIDGRTTRHAGYEISQRKRKCIEQCFGWGKVIGPIRQVMVRGLNKVDQLLTLTMAAYNLTRLRSLAPLRPECAE